MAVKGKDWALDQLRHKRNCYIMTLAAMRLLNSDCILKLQDRVVLLKSETFIFDPIVEDRTGKLHEVSFNQLIGTYEGSPETFQVDLQEFYKFSRRNLLKESFEVVLAYAKTAETLSRLKSEPWYWFAFHIRNAISHDLHFGFKPGSAG